MLPNPHCQVVVAPCPLAFPLLVVCPLRAVLFRSPSRRRAVASCLSVSLSAVAFASGAAFSSDFTWRGPRFAGRPTAPCGLLAVRRDRPRCRRGLQLHFAEQELEHEPSQAVLGNCGDERVQGTGGIQGQSTASSCAKELDAAAFSLFVGNLASSSCPAARLSFCHNSGGCAIFGRPQPACQATSFASHSEALQVFR